MWGCFLDPVKPVLEAGQGPEHAPVHLLHVLPFPERESQMKVSLLVLRILKSGTRSHFFLAAKQNHF